MALVVSVWEGCLCQAAKNTSSVLAFFNQYFKKMLLKRISNIKMKLSIFGAYALRCAFKYFLKIGKD